MSHLAKIVDLQEALSNAAIKCPDQQLEIVESAFVRAIMAYGFLHNGVNVGGLTEACAEKVLTQLDKWNRVSPLHGGRVMGTVKSVLQGLFIGGQKGGYWVPFQTPVLCGFEQVPDAVNTAYENLFMKLRAELTAGEE